MGWERGGGGEVSVQDAAGQVTRQQVCGWYAPPPLLQGGSTDHSWILSVDCLKGSFRQDVKENIPEFESERIL